MASVTGNNDENWMSREDLLALEDNWDAAEAQKLIPDLVDLAYITAEALRTHGNGPETVTPNAQQGVDLTWSGLRLVMCFEANHLVLLYENAQNNTVTFLCYDYEDEDLDVVQLAETALTLSRELRLTAEIDATVKERGLVVTQQDI